MSIEEVLDMPSMNEWGENTVRAWVEWEAEDILEDEEYTAIVEDTMIRGINRDPVHIGPSASVYAEYASTRDMPAFVLASKKMLGNGHHRVAILYLLGFKQVFFTSDYDESYRWTV